MHSRTTAAPASFLFEDALPARCPVSGGCNWSTQFTSTACKHWSRGNLAKPAACAENSAQIATTIEKAGWRSAGREIAAWPHGQRLLTLFASASFQAKTCITPGCSVRTPRPASA